MTSIHQKIAKLDNMVWKSLFCMSKAYENVTIQACSVRLLVLSVSKMLSTIGEIHKYDTLIDRFKNTVYFFKINGCMCDDDFIGKCPNTLELFKFMKKYYNFCLSREGKVLVPYAELDDIYETNKLTKNFWGPKIWYIIHGFAAFYNPTDEYNYLTTYKCFVMCLVQTLPCKVCRSHFLKTITQEMNNINKFSKTNNDLLYWTYLIHNVVNTSLDKETYKWEFVMKEYLMRSNF